VSGARVDHTEAWVVAVDRLWVERERDVCGLVVDLALLGDGGVERDRRIGAVRLENDVVAPVEAVQGAVEVGDAGAGDGVVPAVWICHRVL
jgi:hypothetical protein